MTAEEFKKVYFSLHSKLYKVAVTILKNAEDAEDIIQDAYCKLWDSREKLAEVKIPEAYCVTLVKHLCMDFLRSSKSALICHNIDNHDIVDDSTSVEEEIENTDTIKKVKYIIDKLPEKQKRILDLRGFAGCSIEDIETITGESAVNIRVLLSRARNTVRMKLNR